MERPALERRVTRRKAEENSLAVFVGVKKKEWDVDLLKKVLMYAQALELEKR